MTEQTVPKAPPKSGSTSPLQTVLNAAPNMESFEPFEKAGRRVMSLQGTQRAKLLVRVSAAMVIILVVWAAFAKVDEVTRGDGKVVPSRQLQVIQSLDGGVVTEILVKQGQEVAQGQLLLKIDETRAASGVRESASQGFSLQARAARLRALAEGSAFSPPDAKDAEERKTIEEERRLYESKVNELATLLSINRQQLAQRQQESSEAQARRNSAKQALDSAQQELNQTRPLMSTGAVSQVDILRLERDVSRFQGEVAQTTAQIARIGAAIGEASRKIQETEISFRNEARRDLSEVMGKVNAIKEGSVALVDRVSKSQVKSPVRGRIQRLLANTVGGVVTPGKDIVEIVPLDDTLVLDAKVSPRDIAFIAPGQAAVVKFTAYDFSIYGGMDAKVENISPDTQIDERGVAFYLVRVRTRQASFDDRLPIIPGMTAEVDILTGKKSVLSYLMKPVLRAQAYALRER